MLSEIHTVTTMTPFFNIYLTNVSVYSPGFRRTEGSRQFRLTSGCSGTDARMLCGTFDVNWAKNVGGRGLNKFSRRKSDRLPDSLLGASEPFCMRLVELQICVNSEGLLAPDAN